MLRSFNTAISGLQQFQTEIDVVGNNIANVNTTGFKDARTDFMDSFSQALAGSNAQVGSGVSLAGISSNFNQGTIASTAVGTDLAINGQGFFMVRNTADSSQYATRAGNFHVDTSNYLVDSGGMRVQGFSDAGLSTRSDLQVDGTGAPATTAVGTTVQSFSIDQAGFINVKMTDGTTFVRGQVLLQKFSDPSQLVKEGSNRYSGMAAAGPLAQTEAPQSNGLGLVQSGALEMSNVDLTTEMTNLIIAQRSFQANSSIIKTSDELMQEIVGLKR